MINLTIDGKAIEVAEGTTVLEAARQAEIHIPTLCDHKELTPYGGCRLCLVEVENFRTLQPSCTLPVSNGMVVKTDTPKVREARKFVLSLIFSERNHFCPYCQVSGGDCELQNAAYEQGMDHWPLQPEWHHFEVDASHPYFILENNRCILCRRCVRACDELVGNFTLAVAERGENSMVVADLGVPLGESSCISCGMCVQVCPTGALIDRYSAYKGRDTQVEHHPTLCVGCSVGCGVDVITRDNHVVRIDSDWDHPVNQGVLCQAGRYKPLENDRERILTPLVRKNDNLKAATWDEALKTITTSIQSQAGKQKGVAAVISTRLPAEALYQFKSLFEDGLKSDMTTTLEDGIFSAGVSALARALKQPFEGKLDDLHTADCVLIVGADLQNEHQVAGFFIKRNRSKGTRLIVIDTLENGLEAFADLVIKPGKSGNIEAIKSLSAALSGKVPKDEFGSAAEMLKAAKKPVIICGKNVTGELEIVRSLYDLTTKLGSNARLLSIKGQANSFAAAQYGLEKAFAPEDYPVIYVALGDEKPSPHLLERLADKGFLAVQASYASSLTAMADVVLPVTEWVEQAGHFVNADGRLQKAKKIIQQPDEVRDNVEVLKDLAERLGIQTDDNWQAALTRLTAPVAVR
ncbi:MAG: molybdopterin-dependent oxidoreductase [Anaerolineaceae bacterium]|nr:molybdopterin-dependent oxidoreductase [Anaerolineaceae bacterium]